MRKSFCFIGKDLHRHIEIDGDAVRYDVPLVIPQPWAGLPLKEGDDPNGFVEREVRSFQKHRLIFRKGGGPPIDVFVEVGMLGSFFGPEILFYEVGGSED
jgi:hypothetical protein